MRRGLRNAGLALVLAGIPWIAGSAAAEDVTPYLRQAPSAADYPDASAAVLFANKTMVWQAEDGRLTEDIHTLVKILNARGCEQFGEYRTFYRKGEQRLTLVRAGTYRENGEFTAVEPEAIREDSPLDPATAGLYGNIAQQVIKLPAVAVNAVLETHLERDSKGRAGGFSGVEYFQANEPLREKRLRIVIPKGRPFNWRIVEGEPIQLVRSTEQGMDVYSFYSTDTRRIPEEPSSPPLDGMAARLVYSAYPDWNAALQPFTASYWTSIHQSPRVETFTKKLLAGASTPEERLERIFEFVTRKMANVPLGLSLAGIEPHAPDEILAGRAASAVDKAMLAGAMLSAAGLIAQPVFLNSRFVPLVEEIPAPEQFDSVLLRVELPEGQIMYLDPAGETDSLGWCRAVAGSRGVLVRPEGCAFTDIAPSVNAENLAQNTCLIRLELNGAAALQVDSALDGSFAGTARALFRDRSPADIRRICEDSARRVLPDAAVDDPRSDHLVDVREPVTLAFGIHTGDLGVVQGKVMTLDLPTFPLPFAEVTLFLGLETRLNPLWLGLPAASRTRLELRLPEGFDVLYLPPSLEQSRPEWSARRTWRHDAGSRVIAMEEEVRVVRSVLPVAGYGETRSFFQNWLDRKNNILIIRAKTSAEIDAPSLGGKGE
jgi:hypothetical protein